jgi:hypothetical protein
MNVLSLSAPKRLRISTRTQSHTSLKIVPFASNRNSISITNTVDSRKYGRRDPPCWPRDTLYPQKLSLTSPTSGGHSVAIVRSRTQATFSSVVAWETITIRLRLVEGRSGGPAPPLPPYAFMS